MRAGRLRMRNYGGALWQNRYLRADMPNHSTTTEVVSPAHGRLPVTAPFRCPATPPSHDASTSKTAPNHPTYRASPEFKTSIAKETEEAEENTNAVEISETATSVSEEPQATISISENVHTDFSRTAIQNESETNPEQEGVKSPELYVSLSQRIHVLGFNSHARFMAHALASVPERPPVRILAHHPWVMTRWGEENRSLSLYDKKGNHISSSIIPCPEPIVARREYGEKHKDSDYLDNVLIDTMSTAVLPSLHTLRHRIDCRTTICLLHPGLGLVDKIIEELFDDPAERPNFILGHSTHKVGRHSDHVYSIRQKTPGHIYIHGVPKSGDSTLDKSSRAHEGMLQTQHFIKLLSSTEGLNVVGLPWVKFLSWKLSSMVFSSLADTISVILGCKYGQIRRNPHAMSLWDNLLDETLAIISQFPELQSRPHRLEYFQRDSFRRKLQTYLIGQGANTSAWIKQVRMGSMPPIDYFNGYFVARAKELGLDYKYNSMAIRTVKARMAARQRELRMDIPLGLSPYMMDSDQIGGGQPVSGLEDDLDLDEF
ncbi:hypothetical protein F5Y19DRAFT_477023 [Xylariaceae sp. FL1651]|nr:hypothetical protein F5Y19DRAFT_477023 [Xylariaceae sp. FL1651]